MKLRQILSLSVFADITRFMTLMSLSLSVVTTSYFMVLLLSLLDRPMLLAGVFCPRCIHSH